jgi:hypothetical protein
MIAENKNGSERDQGTEERRKLQKTLYMVEVGGMQAESNTATSYTHTITLTHQIHLKKTTLTDSIVLIPLVSLRHT